MHSEDFEWHKSSLKWHKGSLDNVGIRVSSMRVGEGLSCADVATAINISVRHYIKIEAGHTRPSKAVLEALFEKFNLDPIWVETGEGLPIQGDESVETQEFLAQLEQGYLEDMESDLGYKLTLFVRKMARRCGIGTSKSSREY